MSNWTSEQIASYAEAGNMLRHYSTSRTAVLSVVIPVCLGILGFALTPGLSNKLGIYLLVAEGMLSLYGMCLSIFFSVKYEQTRQLLVRMEAGGELKVYSAVISMRPRGFFVLDSIDVSLIVVNLLLHIAYYGYYFFHA